MNALSRLSTALILSAAIILAGNWISLGLSDVAAAAMGLAAAGAPNGLSLGPFWLSGILFAAGVLLAVISCRMEKK